MEKSLKSFIREYRLKNKSIFYNLISIIMRNINKDTLVEEYINKDTLVEEYINSTDIIYSNSSYNLINNHYNKDYDNYDETRIIKIFIKEQLFILSNDWKMNYDDIDYWIAEIDRFDVCEHADSSVDLYDNDLIKNYEFFEDWTDIDSSNSSSVLEIMKLWQFDWYYELYNSIKEDFIEFLNEKLDNFEKLED